MVQLKLIINKYIITLILDYQPPGSGILFEGSGKEELNGRFSLSIYNIGVDEEGIINLRIEVF